MLSTSTSHEEGSGLALTVDTRFERGNAFQEDLPNKAYINGRTLATH